MLGRLATRLLPVLLTLAACDGSTNNSDPAVVEHAFSVESIVAGNTDPANLSFMYLYDGVAYNRADAIANSSKVDFAYNYHGGGCSTCRFFENATSMSTRTGYVSQFSTITNSTILNVEQSDGITASDFDEIRSSSDIESLFTTNDLMLHTLADVTNRVTDVAVGKVFAFIDKAERKGFFLIGDYTANVPDGDKATLQLQVKIQP